MRIIFIRDLKGNEYPLVTSSKQKEELGTNDSIRFKIHNTKNHQEFLNQTTDLEKWIVGDIVGINEYQIVYSKKVTIGDSFYMDVIANPYVIEKLDDMRIYKRYDQYFNPTQFFDLVFNGTPFVYILTTTANSIMWEGVGDGESRLTTFTRGLKRYNLEFEIVGNVVYLRDKIGNDTNFEYRYNLNAANIVKETDAQDFYTIIYGFGDFDLEEKNIEGKVKLKRVYRSPLADIYGELEAPPVRDGRVKDSATMDRELKRIVDSSLKISFTADIYDLSKRGYDYQHAKLGDRVFLVDERLKEDVEVRIVGIETDRDADGKILDLKITFGTLTSKDSHKKKMQSSIKDFSEIMAGRKNLPFEALDIMSRTIVSAIQATTSEIVYDSNGQHFIDKSDPNKLMTMNSSGLLLSLDGGRTAKTAISPLGIVADAITTGTLQAIIIKAVEMYGSYIEGTEIRGGKIYGTEIYGSTLTGGTIYTDADNDHYISLKGSELVSRGIQTRKWFGTTSNDHIRAMIYDGQFRVRNDDKQWSAYFSDMGISTQWDGSGDYIKEGVSGAIELHSRRYSDGDYSGMTLYSDARLALETNGGRIYLNPKGANVHVADARDNYYGISASTFSQSSERELKRDIKAFEGNASDIIKDLLIREYKRLTGGEETTFDQWQLGLIVDEAPREVLANGSSVDIYSYVNLIAKSLQEILPRLDKLEEKVS